MSIMRNGPDGADLQLGGNLLVYDAVLWYILNNTMLLFDLCRSLLALVLGVLCSGKE